MKLLIRILILTMMINSTAVLAQSNTPITIPLNELIGQYNEKTHSNFIALDSTILPVNKTGMYLQKEPTKQLILAYQAFKKHHPTIPFVIVSATRNYTYQNGIWQRKWQNLFPKYKDSMQTANAILQYSSMPGTSRHHWGTDVDITSLSSDYFRKNAQGKILYAWLLENMPKFGFCQAFTEGRNSGYQPEEWHWSYQPIAKQYIHQYKEIMEQQPETIINKLTFAGHDNLTMKQIIEEYVYSVNAECY